MSVLEQLNQVTKMVIDTGDCAAIQQHRPEDATTNPALILQSAKDEQYQHLVQQAIQDTQGQDVSATLDQVTVNFGCEILALIPGRVSSEVNAALSFDIEGSIQAGEKLIQLYEKRNIARERVLIKIAATWEGIQAAKQLEKKGIACNLTLLFSQAQAVACANANVTLISPFVGRILDWHVQQYPDQDFSGLNDPGVQSVASIYNLYKQHDVATEVMGASFRNVNEILSLSGCDLLTVSPKLLQSLSEMNHSINPQLSVESAKAQCIEPDALKQSESTFRWTLNADAMATFKLAEGIRSFNDDRNALVELVKAQQ